MAIELDHQPDLAQRQALVSALGERVVLPIKDAGYPLGWVGSVRQSENLAVASKTFETAVEALVKELLAEAEGAGPTDAMRARILDSLSGVWRTVVTRIAEREQLYCDYGKDTVASKPA